MQTGEKESERYRERGREKERERERERDEGKAALKEEQRWTKREDREVQVSFN